MLVLVTGGAGYIGSHILCQLRDAGHEAVALDNLYAGHRWAVGESELVELDVGDRDGVERLLADRRFDAVVHCAGHIWVGESTRDPAKYYHSNAGKAFTFFNVCAQQGVPCILFSSTAAVYGEPTALPIAEDAPLRPINPYGASKLMAERALADIAAAHGCRFAILRYFNVAGADLRLRVGEATPDNSHLVKVACQTAIGLRSSMRINGDDFPTPDGTCIRDYLHVDDLARAHLAALERLRDGAGSLTLNCGYGHGFSVREVLETVRKVSGVPFPIEIGARRAGDPPALVADATRLHRDLDWQPRHDSLEEIVMTAWAWEEKLGRITSCRR